MFSKNFFIFTVWLFLLDSSWSTDTGECSWLNPQFCGNDEPGPVSAIYFVHMRKSGGSSVAAMIKNWMIDQGCVNSTWAKDHPYMIDIGWIHGRPVINRVDPATIPAVGAETCPHFALVHNEDACVNGVQLLASATSRALPPLATVLPVPQAGTAMSSRMVYFTTLRDPIERIGSQAFYHNGLGLLTINAIARRMCGGYMNGMLLCKQRPHHKACPCVSRAKTKALAQLKSRPQMWLDWFSRSDLRVWQGDHYARNYYIRRLMGVPSDSVLDRRAGPVEACMRNPSECVHIPAASLGYRTFAALGHLIYCQTDRTEPLEAVDWDAALQRAKDVLRDHFELVITERMSGDAAKVVLQRVFGPDFLSAQAQTSVLRVNNQDAISFNTSRSQTGKGSAAAESRSYTSFMPESVVAYLQKENAADIELYRYAVELFEARAATATARKSSANKT